MRLFTLVLLIILIAPTPSAADVAAPSDTGDAAPSATAAWRLPVLAPVARGFDPGANPYEGGHHRGVDFHAPTGAVVHAPCGGRVVVAGRIGSSGGVVTVLCGRWRATVLPLSTILVRRGAQVSTRTRVGILARSPAHRGLHLGVRRDGVRFGYVDPIRFLTPRPTGPSPLGRAPRGRPTPPPTPAPLIAAPRRTAPRAPAVPGHVAPWPAWAGLALVLAGLGVGTRRRGRARRERRRGGQVAARSAGS